MPMTRTQRRAAFAAGAGPPTGDARIDYEVAPACGGWKVAVYRRTGLVDIQLHNADSGRVWERREDAEERAAELRLLPPQPYRIVAGLCCLPCRYHHPFSDFGRSSLCCLGCGRPARLNPPGAMRSADTRG